MTLARPARRRRWGLLACLGLLCGALAACSDFDRILDDAFPPVVPGLSAEQPWVALPVGRWVTEGGIQGQAMAACFSPACTPRAAVGIFQANEVEAAQLAAIIDHPAWLQHGLAHGDSPPARRPGREPGIVTVEPFADAPFKGFVIRLARRDGSRAAFGAALMGPGPGTRKVVIAIAATADAARGLARDVARQP